MRGALLLPLPRCVPWRLNNQLPRQRRQLGRNDYRWSLRVTSAGSESQVFSADELVQSGAIVGAHGLKGEVRVIPFTDFVEERYFSPNTQYLEDSAQGRTADGMYDKPPGSLTKIKIVGGRSITSKGRNDCIVKFKGVNNRTSAEALIGRRLYIRTSDRPQLRDEDVGDGDDEFYAQELDGLQVVLQSTGESVGVVVDVYRGAGTHDLLKVIVPPLPSAEGEEEVDSKKRVPEEYVFIPFVKEIVPVVDIINGVLKITPPTGLLDLRQKAKKPKSQRRVTPPPPKKKTA